MQHNYKVNKPLIPPLIHDDNTRITIFLVAIPILLFMLFKILQYFNK